MNQNMENVETRGRKKGSGKLNKYIHLKVSNEMYEELTEMPNYSEFIRDLIENKNSGEVIKYLRFLNDFFKDNIDYLMKNYRIDRFIEENEDTFNKIEELVK